MAYELIDDEPQSKYELLDDEPAKPAAPVEMPGYAQGLAQQAAQGLGFGWADEAADVLGIQPKETFRTQEKMFRKENPWAAGVANLAGGIAPAIFPLTRSASLSHRVAQMPRAAGVMRNVGYPVGIGGAYGALTGAGEGETFDERVQNAWQQGLMGAALTPVGQLVGHSLKGIYKSGKEALKGFLGSKSPGVGGVDLLAKSMKEEGLDPNVIARQVEEQTKATGKPVMWIDFVDANKYPKTYDLMSKGLLQGTSTDPKMKLIERAEGTPERLIADIKRRISPTGEVSDLKKNIRAEKLARKGTWESAFDPIKGVPVDTPEVMEVLNRPFAQKAIKLAIETAQETGDKNAKSMFANFVANDPQTGQFVWRKAPTLELIQTIKNLGYTPALADAYAGKDMGTAARNIAQQQRDLLAAVDAAVPDYKGIRSNWADASSILAAREKGAKLQRALNLPGMKEGEKIKGVQSEDIIEDFNAMSPPEKKAFKEGLASWLIGKVRTGAEKETGMKYTSLVGEPGATESSRLRQLQEIMGDNDRFKNFLDRIKAEKAIEKTGQEFARRRGASADEPASKIARDVVRIGGASVLGRMATAIPAIGSQVGSFVAGQSPRLMQPVAELATQTARGPAPMIDRLLSRYGRERGDLTVQDLMSPYLTAATGEAAGDALDYKQGGLARYCSCKH
jgi:hypothetical protein